ncbi:LCP family protein [Actinomadura atramentaria]|uniref:LCP family protein n=1 Tax=Actinomadura atramentaria TaxID=1990 RepID=UPI000371DD3A|nr:LCP family protein [Actinomadura atramentaria]
MASRTNGRRTGRDAPDDAGGRAAGLPTALALTLASALVWGLAHLWAGRRVAGALLLVLYTALVGTALYLRTFHADDLYPLVGRSDLMGWFAGGAAAVALVWIAVVVRSYLVVRPGGLAVLSRAAGTSAVLVLCLVVAAPFALAAHHIFVLRDTLGSIFQAGGLDSDGHEVDTSDPWNGRSRVNILLLGGDAAADRTGVRTDSMTVASIDTRSGDTVLLSLPRNLEHFELPPGPARDRFPQGFTGDGPATPGLLNEVYEYAEDHPDMVPGVARNHRGPALLKKTISGILGQPVDYYILVDMFGFADIVDAMGGVKVRITQPIPFGRQGGVLQPGYRTLKGKEALWYGRSRNDSDDYARMGRQKCLLRAIARQADAETVLTKFDRLATAAKHTLSSDIPEKLLPSLIKLSGRMKDGAKIDSLQFVPPLISTAAPDFALIRRLAAKAVSGGKADGPSTAPSSPADSPSGEPASPPTAGGQNDDDGGSVGGGSHPVSLEAACPS